MKEDEIRPQDIFDEYLRLSKLDINHYFTDTTRTEIDCPSCSSKSNYSFTKDGFDFKECPNCLTLYVSPRPEYEAFSKYYSQSESSKYWATTFYKKTAEARREKLWKPKARAIYDIIQKYIIENYTVYDIGGGYGLFAEEFEIISNNKPIIIEPGVELKKVLENKKFTVIHKFLEEVNKNDFKLGQKVFVSFELFEHLHDPSRFLKCLYDLMDENDYFIFTTLSGTGFDIRLLWDKSKSVSPPHHLNFFNPSSIKFLLSKIGYNEIEVTTPGKLDVDIVFKNLDSIVDKFWLSYFQQTSISEHEKLQEFLVLNTLSSHMMITCKK